MRFADKIVVVTGGAQGIGEATARRFASEGAKVIIADLNTEGAQSVAQELGNGSAGYHLDVTKSSSFIELFDQVEAVHGTPDIMVNNAGISGDTPTIELSDETWQRELDVNLNGALFGSREAARRFIKAEKAGSIVNISSIAALRAVSPERHVGYDVAKAGIRHMVSVLGYEWAKQGIRVNAVAPGYADTQILKDLAESDPEMVDTWISQTPFGRLMQPSEIAAVICFLASEDAGVITGQTIVADGGYSL